MSGFDPITWGLGYGAKLVADSLLTKLSSRDFRSGYSSVVVEWADTDVQGTVDPQVFLCVPIEGAIDLSRFIQLDDSLSEAELTKHFLHRWRTIVSTSGNVANLTPFFHLNESEAAEKLLQLVRKIIAKDRNENGAFVRLLRELVEDDTVRLSHAKEFVKFADFASNKRLLYTELAIEGKAPLGALYESAKSLRSAVHDLITSLRDTTHHQNVLVIAKMLQNSCVNFMHDCEMLNTTYGFSLGTDGRPIDSFSMDAREDVQSALLVFRASFCDALIKAMSELGANVPVSVVSGIRGGTWPLTENRAPSKYLLIDGITWQLDDLYIIQDSRLAPYIRIGTLGSDAILQDVYLPEGTQVVQLTPSERKSGRYGGFYSITPGRDWYVDGQLVRKGEKHEF